MPVAVERGYVTLAEVKSTLSIGSGETYIDDDLSRAINAASQAIDGYCGQRFYHDTVNVTRTLTAADVNRINAPEDVNGIRLPIASVTTLRSDHNGDGIYEIIWDAADYYLRPIDAALDSQPYSHIVRRGAATNTFPTGEGRIQVVGRFGWPNLPAAVVEAARIQTTRLVTRTREAPLGVAGLAFEGGAMRLLAKLDPDVEVLLDLSSLVVRQMVR